MIRRLRSYQILKVCSQDPISETKFANIIARIGALCQVAPEIFEMDLNPLLGKGDKIVAVDARIRIEK